MPEQIPSQTDDERSTLLLVDDDDVFRRVLARALERRGYAVSVAATVDAALLSPVDGIVTSRVAEPGEQLQAGSPICVITRLSDAWLTVYVSGEDLARIRIGQEATVTTDGGETREGRLTYISSKAEFTPKNVQTRDERVKLVYRVKVGLDNADGFFKPGMPAEAALVPVESGP